MDPQLKNKMINILSSICMIISPEQYTALKIKEIINDNNLMETIDDKDTKKKLSEKIKNSNAPEDLIVILENMIAKKDKPDFAKFFIKIQENQDNIKKIQDTGFLEIKSKEAMIKNLSKYLKIIQNFFTNDNINFYKLSFDITKYSNILINNYKKDSDKSYTKKWLKNISRLCYEYLPKDSDEKIIKKHEKEYLKKLKKALSQRPRIFEGNGAAVSDKQVRKDLKELIKIIDKKIITYS